MEVRASFWHAGGLQVEHGVFRCRWAAVSTAPNLACICPQSFTSMLFLTFAFANRAANLHTTVGHDQLSHMVTFSVLYVEETTKSSGQWFVDKVPLISQNNHGGACTQGLIGCFMRHSMKYTLHLLQNASWSRSTRSTCSRYTPDGLVLFYLLFTTQTVSSQHRSRWQT